MTEPTDADRREMIGGNNPPLARSIAAEEGDFAAVTTAFLEEEYGKHTTIVQSLLDEATALMRDPKTGDLKPIADNDTKEKVKSLIKRMRDEVKALDAAHGKEKTPYFRGGQAVDQFFFAPIDKLARRDKKNQRGAADVLNDMLTDYDTMLLRQEQERRRLEAERLEREAREKRDREEALRVEAENKRLAAERAKKPAIIEEKKTAATTAETEHSAAKIEATVGEDKAEAARIDTMRPAADIMRSRGAGGTLSTMVEEKYSEIIDRSKLDLVALSPHIPLDGLQKALNAWAKQNDYRVPMEGAAIGRRPKSRVV